jgi:uncharacterized alpha-E superfamily protein
MLARIAQELFWLGRDLTRAEHTARILDGAFHADVSGVPGEGGITLSWEGVLATIGAKPPAPGEEETEVPDRRLGRIEVARMLTLDTDSPASVVSCVARARERGRTMRDVISTEMWEALNSFYLLLGRYDLPAALQTGPYSFYQEVKENCGLFWGLTDRTMLRDEARAFLEAGARIEDADMVLRMLRRAVRSAPSVVPVARFLLFNSAYPGSVASSIDGLAHSLTQADAQPRSSPPVLRLDRLIADLELQRRAPEAGGALEDILERVQDELALVDRDVDARYFAIAAIAAVHL